MPLPISQLPLATVRNITAILSDIDDTISLHGRLPAVAFDAMERLHKAGILIIPVTGRPAGWCDHIARMWPIDGIVGENGAFYFRYDDNKKVMTRRYAQAADVRTANKVRLLDIAGEVLKQFPGTAIASDQNYREIDVAIDYCEDVPALPLAVAQEIAGYFHKHGATAKVSSIHVNAWFGTHDKLIMSKQLLRSVFNVENEKLSVAYCGDSPNDAPMFAHFPVSIGVANIKPFLAMIDHQPQYVTASEGGLGFAEFADIVLRARA